MIRFLKKVIAKLFGPAMTPPVPMALPVVHPTIDRTATDGLFFTRIEPVNGGNTSMPGEGLFRRGGSFSFGSSSLHTNYYADWAKIDESAQHFRLRSCFRRWMCYNVIRSTWDYGPTIVEEDVILRRGPNSEFTAEPTKRPGWAKV